MCDHPTRVIKVPKFEFNKVKVVINKFNGTTNLGERRLVNEDPVTLNLATMQNDKTIVWKQLDALSTHQPGQTHLYLDGVWRPALCVFTRLYLDGLKRPAL
ncbi:unnamed protein product [Camellia sinensis]